MGQEPQIGGGDTVSKSVPTRCWSVGDAAEHRRAALRTSAASRPARSIYCWGLNALVDTSGHNAGLASVPTQLQSTLAWSQVATGASHTCALTTDQDAYCWGSNQLGQLGTRGDTTSMFAPTLVYGGFKFSVDRRRREPRVRADAVARRAVLGLESVRPTRRRHRVESGGADPRHGWPRVPIDREPVIPGRARCRPRASRTAGERCRASVPS